MSSESFSRRCAATTSPCLCCPSLTTFRILRDFSQSLQKLRSRIGMSSQTGCVLLSWDQGKLMTQYEHENLVRRKGTQKGMRAVFLRTGSDFSYSATPVSGHPDLQLAMPISSVDLILHERSRLRPRCAYSASRSSFQFRE